MKVNFNTQNYGYTNTKKAKNPAFAATIKDGTLAKTVGEIRDIIGGDEAKNLVKKLDEFKNQIKEVKADKKDFEITFGFETSKNKNIHGREYTELSPTASSKVGEETVFAKRLTSISNIEPNAGHILANRFIDITEDLARKIEGCKTRITEKAQVIENSINNKTGGFSTHV